jgi:hypothetical protein
VRPAVFDMLIRIVLAAMAVRLLYGAWIAG